METESRIRVAVRIRPPLERERYDTMCSRKLDDGQSVTMTNEDNTASTFSFDYSFDDSDDQRTVYEEAAQEMIDLALEGNNATIFTYGQTGSGKTFTVLGRMGDDGAISSQSGLFLRVFDDLFSYKRNVAKRKTLVITLAAVELYVDEVMDLLNNKAKIKLREIGDDCLMPGLNCVEVNEMRDVVKQFQIANSFRSVTATKMNDASSRSHALFLIDVFQLEPTAVDLITKSGATKLTASILVDEYGNPKPTAGVRKSRVALVDLAGSERVKRSGVEGQGMVEAQAINKSLSTLGTVINAMYLQSSHVPFRESKLTKILKTSFIDKTSRLLLIGQVAPASESLSESLGTLRFCDRVKNLKVGGATNSGFVNPEEEAAYLATLKSNEMLCADIRILQLMCYYQVQRPKYIALVKNAAPEVVIKDVVTQLQASAPAREHQVEESYRRRFTKEAEEDRDDIVKRFTRDFDKLKSEVEKEEKLAKSESKSKKKLKEEHEAATEEKMLEAKKLKKTRLQAEDRIAKVKEELEKAHQELQELRKGTKGIGSPSPKPSKRLKAGDHGFDDDDDAPKKELPAKNAKKPSMSNFDDSDDDENDAPANSVATPSRASAPPLTPEDAEWQEFERDWERAEANHDVVADFHHHVRSVHMLHMEYVDTLTRNWLRWGEANRIRFRNSEILTSSTLIPDIIAFMVERAMLISEGVIQHTDTYAWFDIDGMSKRLKGPYELTPPLLTEGDRDPIPMVPVEYPAQTYLGETEEEGGSDSDGQRVNALPNTGNATTREARERRRKMKGNGVTKKYDTEEADRQYLMTVYDSSTLVHDVTKYLKAGTVMLKHGRSGKPHNRLFWVTTVSFRVELVWVDPDNRTGERSCVSLNDVSYIALGCFGKVFKRHPVANTQRDFFQSFSVGLKDGGRTVDIVASTLPDFEAWVLGLCHLSRVDPHWGKSLDISMYPETKNLTTVEKHLCSEQYIFPSDYLHIKEKVLRLRDEVAMHLRLFGNDQEQAYASLGGIHVPQVNDRGAVLMTKGELRYHCSPFHIDIFRVCKIWVLFHEMNIIYDPSFTPATNFGNTHK